MLFGSLPCVVCGYELQGLSIRGMCPECGAAVRATILQRVDPEADELQPLRTPVFTSVSIVVWMASALAAVLASWLAVAARIGWYEQGWPPLWRPAGWIVLTATLVSGVAAIGLVRLTDRSPKRHRVCAIVGVASYVPALAAIWWIMTIDATHGPAYFDAGALEPDRLIARLMLAAALAGVILGLRPNARELVHRSMALRTGRVDRQTLLAMVAALAIAAFGDSVRLLGLAAHPADVPVYDVTGTVIVAVASAFFTVGVARSLVDSARISRAMFVPAYSLTHVLGPRRTGGS